MQCSGAPAATAASWTIRTVSWQHFRAPRCGLKMTGLRVFRQISALKMVVDVGLVTGVSARIGPIGCATSVIPRSGSWERTPTVRCRRMCSWMRRLDQAFFTTLCSTRPMPVSAKASWARVMRASKAALKIASTTRSTCAWSKVRRTSAAAWARPSSSSAWVSN